MKGSRWAGRTRLLRRNTDGIGKISTRVLLINSSRALVYNDMIMAVYQRPRGMLDVRIAMVHAYAVYFLRCYFKTPMLRVAERKPVFGGSSETPHVKNGQTE